MLDRIIQKARDFADLMGRSGRERRALRAHESIIRARALRYAFTDESPEWTPLDQARWLTHLPGCQECRERGERLQDALRSAEDK